MKSVVTVFLILLSVQVEADDGLYLIAGLGVSKSDITSRYQINGENETNKNFDYQVLAGYRFKNNVQIELGSIAHASLDVLQLSDKSNVCENVFLVGYAMDINERIKIVPRLGYSQWRLESSEGSLFNSGPEAKSSIKGEELFYSLSATYVALYATLQLTNYEFGSLSSLIIGVELDI